MADNVAITAGAGTNIATDDTGSAHEQIVKLDLGKNGTFTGYVGGEAVGSDFGMYVVPRPYDQQQSQNSAGLTTASTNYTAGDTLGTGWTYTSAARASGGLGVITGVVARDLADVMTSMTLYIFSASVTFGTDNSAPSISDSDTQYLCGRIPLSFEDLGGVRVATADSLAVPYWCSGGTSLYVYAMTTVANNFFGAATDLPINLFYRPT